MGYYPKHLKQRRQRRILRTIAHAALAGGTLVSYVMTTDDFTGQWIEQVRWCVRFPDGKESGVHRSKREAALHYLFWWYNKNDMWPRHLK